MTSEPSSWPRMVIGNVVVDLLDREQAIRLMAGSLDDSRPLAVLSANLHHVHEFSSNPSWSQERCGDAESIRWLTLLDGVPLVAMASALTARRWRKLAGSDLIEPVLRAVAARGARVGFLGGSEEMHGRLRPVLAERIPELQFAGAWAPDRRTLSDLPASLEIASCIAGARVDVLVIALSKPLQENWVRDYGLATGACLFLAFGAATDFMVGRIKRAPRWMSTLGVEWLWRLMLEPHRLWRRYLVEGPPTLVRVLTGARMLESTPTVQG